MRDIYADFESVAENITDIFKMMIEVNTDDKSYVLGYPNGYRIFPFKLSGFLQFYPDINTQKVFYIAVKDPCFTIEFI